MLLKRTRSAGDKCLAMPSKVSWSSKASAEISWGGGLFEPTDPVLLVDEADMDDRENGISDGR